MYVKYGMKSAILSDKSAESKCLQSRSFVQMSLHTSQVRRWEYSTGLFRFQSISSVEWTFAKHLPPEACIGRCRKKLSLVKTCFEISELQTIKDNCKFLIVFTPEPSVQISTHTKWSDWQCIYLPNAPQYQDETQGQF